MNDDFLIKLKKNKINMEKFYTAFRAARILNAGFHSL